MLFFHKKFLLTSTFFFIVWATLIAVSTQANLQQMQRSIDDYCKIVPGSLSNDIYSTYSKEKLSSLINSAQVLQGQTVPKFSHYDLSKVISEKNFLLVANHSPLSNRQKREVEQFSDVSIESVDFSNQWLKEQLLSKINDEVSTLTNGNINDFFDLGLGSEQTILIASNVVYLKDRWGVGGDDRGRIDFLNENGQFEKKVHAFELTASEQVRYAKKANEYEVFSIPLQNKRLEMQIALPAQGVTPDSLLRAQGLFSEMITSIRGAGSLQQALNGTNGSKEVSLVLPKFSINKKHDLSGHISITDFWQKPMVFQEAFIKVDENGVEAGAATGAVADCIKDFFEVVIDRPFAFWILDTENDLILFVGKVYHPEYEK